MTGPVRDYICVDLETTGLNPKSEKIIEIGAVKVTDGRIADTFSQFVHPGKKLEARIAELTGISDENLEGQPRIEEVLPSFLEFAGDLPLLGHNVLFDYSFLKRAAVNQRFTFERKGIDTLKIARRYLPDLPSRNLGALCEYYQIPHQAHRAYEDAKATHLLYQKLCELFYFESGNQENTAESCGTEIPGRADSGAGAPDKTGKAGSRADFFPQTLSYQVKREGPATPAQKERLNRLLKQYGITPDYEVEWLTKNEASRKIDRLLAVYGVKK